MRTSDGVFWRSISKNNPNVRRMVRTDKWDGPVAIRVGKKRAKQMRYAASRAAKEGKS